MWPNKSLSSAKQPFLIPGGVYYIKNSTSAIESIRKDVNTLSSGVKKLVLQKRSLVIYIPLNRQETLDAHEMFKNMNLNPLLLPQVYAVLYQGYKYYIIDLYEEPEYFLSREKSQCTLYGDSPLCKATEDV